MTKVRAIAFLKVVYTEIQYWLVGMTPEGYHLKQGRNYEQLVAYSRAAHHYRRFLEWRDHGEIRARLGICYAMLDMNAESVTQYRKALEQWDHPAIMIGLAQVEFRTGNAEAARQLLQRVQASESAQDLQPLIAELEKEMSAPAELLRSSEGECS